MQAKHFDEKLLVNLTAGQYRRLRALATGLGESMAQVVREAIEAYTATKKPPLSYREIIEQTAGAWKDRKDIKDGVSYENEIRKGWAKRWKRELSG